VDRRNGEATAETLPASIQNRGDEPGLAPHVLVQGAGGDPGCLGEPVHADAGEPVLVEDGFGAGDDAFARRGHRTKVPRAFYICCPPSASGVRTQKRPARPEPDGALLRAQRLDRLVVEVIRRWSS